MNHTRQAIQLRLPYDLLKSIDLAAARRYQSRSQFIRDAALARLTITDKDLIAPKTRADVHEENTRNAA